MSWNKDEFEQKFTETGHSVMDWCALHPKATAVIIAVVVCVVIGAYFF